MGKTSDASRPIYVISIAAELAGVHPQTLRVYERKGLLSPKRTSGNSRRYSEEDIALLRRIQELTNDGINLAGVLRILDLEDELRSVRNDLERATRQAEILEARVQESIDAQQASAMVPFRDVRRIKRAMKVDIIDRAGKRRTFAVPPVGGNEQGG